MKEKKLRREILKYAYDKRTVNDQGTADLREFSNIEGIDFGLKRSSIHFLQNEGLIEKVDEGLNSIKITTNGIKTYEDNDLMNKVLPLDD